MRTKRIFLWTALLSGLAGSTLWATAHSDWAQDRLFGRPLPLPPSEEKRQIVVAETQRILDAFDFQSGQRFEDRCNQNAYVVMYSFYGIFEKNVGTVLVEGDTPTSRTTIRDLAHGGKVRMEVSHSQKLSLDQLYEIWSPIEQMHPIDPPRDESVEAVYPKVVIDGYGVMFAVCQGGQLWVAEDNSPDRDSPISKAAWILHRYLVATAK